MFFSDMERKTLAITPPLLLLSSFFFHLRGAAFGSSKAFHCLLLLSCILLSSVHNLAEYDSFGSSNGYNIASTAKEFQSFNGVAIQNVCPSSQSWSNPVLMSNNLSSVVVWLSLRPVHIIEFLPELLSPLNIGKKDTRELSVLVSGKYCGGNGFMVQHQCEGISLEPGDSIKFLFFYQTDSDLEHSWSSSGIGVLAVPMKATAPVLMLNIGKKTVFWVRTKKFSVAVLVLAALLLILVFCFSDHFVEEDNKRSSHITVRKVEKPSTITISPEMDSILRSISSETLQGVVTNGSKDEVSKNIPKPITSLQEEVSEAVNLSVKTANEKKRRRNKKKKNRGIRELTSEHADVSSSHSGTSSTPSSPMSPEPTTNQTTTKPVKPPKPVLSHSATFPISGVKSMMMIERSSLAPNVRAPGAKSRTEAKEEKATKEYRYYDIWGDHLTGLNLMDRFKQVREGKINSGGFGEDDYSESFFVKGPQNYLADSHARFVSFCNQWG